MFSGPTWRLEEYSALSFKPFLGTLSTSCSTERPFITTSISLRPGTLGQNPFFPTAFGVFYPVSILLWATKFSNFPLVYTGPFRDVSRAHFPKCGFSHTPTWGVFSHFSLFCGDLLFAFNGWGHLLYPGVLSPENFFQIAGPPSFGDA